MVLRGMTLFLGLVLGFGVVAEQNSELKTAVFAGGCFWCMEPPFDKIAGVKKTVSGYSGGDKAEPTYQEVSAGGTGHLEVVQITYDPKQVSYEKLLDVYWRNIDPYDEKGQFCDKGESYKSAVFYADEEQKKAFQESLKKLKEKGLIKGEVATKLLKLKEFYPAEDYHQDYYKKNPLRYKYYRFRCGRDQRLKEIWQ